MSDRRQFRQREGARPGSARFESRAMLSVPPGTKGYLASKPVDTHNCFTGLSVLASDRRAPKTQQAALAARLAGTEIPKAAPCQTLGCDLRLSESDHVSMGLGTAQIESYPPFQPMRRTSKFAKSGQAAFIRPVRACNSNRAACCMVDSGKEGWKAGIDHLRPIHLRSKDGQAAGSPLILTTSSRTRLWRWRASKV
jgi:hypothetical protein